MGKNKNKKQITETTEATATEVPASTDMAATLEAAGKKAEEQKAARRERVVKGAHLLGALKETAEKAGLKIEEKSGFLKISGVAKGRNVYVARKGGRVDLSGFTIEASAVKQISEQEARDKHLGKVRGMLDFDQDDKTVLKAFSAALEKLTEEPAAPVAEKSESK